MMGKNARLDLWFESLIVSDENYYAGWLLLDDSERAKANRFVRELDRRCYVASHAKLRQILAIYLELPPEKIVFVTQSNGKPFIANDERHDIKFNLSHSGNYLAVAVSCGYDIGVDIEVWTESVEYEAVVKLCFADSERFFWSTLPQEEKKEFFYKQWTRKESFVKAVGTGLSLDVSQVVTEPNDSSQFISLPAEQGLLGNWRLIDLKLAKGLSGAVTVLNANNPTISYRCLV